MKRVLIQLLGGQTQPNIFSVLSVLPDEVVNLYTATTEQQRDQIEGWFARYGEQVKVQPIMRSLLIDERDQLYSTRSVIKKELMRTLGDKGVQMYLNMTGGTKLMSVVAVQMCLSLEYYSEQAQKATVSVPIFYVNTQARRFEFLSHGELENEVLLSRPFSQGLTVRQLVEMGNMRVVGHHEHWEKAYEAALLLSRRSNRFVLSEDYEIKMNREKLLRAAKTPITEWGNYGMANLPDMRGGMEQFVQEAAKKREVIVGMESCGFEFREGNFYLSQAKVEAYEKQRIDNKDQAKAILLQLQQAQNFLVGGWWELLVAHAMKASGKYTEILWSVFTLPTSLKEGCQAVPMETDIIACDGVSLCCVSCKRGKHISHMTQQFEQHGRRSQILGGVMSEGILAVGVPQKVPDTDAIVRMAKEERLEVWWRDDIERMERG